MCSQGVMLAMVCMMRAGPALFPAVFPDACSSGVPDVAVDRSRGIFFVSRALVSLSLSVTGKKRREG